MLPIDKVPQHHRCLNLISRFSELNWNQERDSAIRWTRLNAGKFSEAQVAEILELIDRPLSVDEYPLTVIYAYADIPQGFEWDLAFNDENLEEVESTQAIFQFSVILKSLVVNELSHGWHQTAVIRFPQGLPSLIQQLPEYDPKSGSATRIVNLSQQQDYSEIKRLWRRNSP